MRFLEPFKLSLILENSKIKISLIYNIFTVFMLSNTRQRCSALESRFIQETKSDIDVKVKKGGIILS
jgi:hypothetical protein